MKKISRRNSFLVYPLQQPQQCTSIQQEDESYDVERLQREKAVKEK